MTYEPKKITIADLFTEQELKKAFAIIAESERKKSYLGGIPAQTLNDMLQREVVTPAVMQRINEKTGQENNTTYFCYVLQHAYTQTQGKTP